MSNPRLIAQDIARHYEANHKRTIPHSKNIRKYLRKPVLAITRRILLPRINYDDSSSISHDIGNEQFGENAHFDPTFLKGREGLDWRDYLTTTAEPSVKESRAGDETDTSCFSMSETETEIEEERRPIVNTQDPIQAYRANMKLNSRALARMDAFLSGCALGMPNDAVSSTVRIPKKRPIVGMNMPKLRSSLVSMASSLPFDFGKKHQNQSLNGQNQDAGTAAGSSRGDPPRRSKPGPDPNRTYPQMHMNDLTLRLELYIRTLRRVYSTFHPKQTQTMESIDKAETKPGTATTTCVSPENTIDECVIHLEPQRALKTRINLILNSLISTAGSVGTMHFILTNLMTHFTREMLAVELLSDNLHSSIRKIVLEYEHQTSFASLAFLSTPEDSAETQLAPLLSKYVDYLIKDRKKFVWECCLESSLARAINPGMRKMFKTVEFRSIGHLLEVCHEYRHPLENIVISSKDSILTQFGLDDGSGSDHDMNILSNASFEKNKSLEMCGNSKTIKQALRDLRRETILVNGQILPPVQNMKELVNLLRERLNSRTIRLKEKKVGNTNVHGHKSRRGNNSQIGADNAASNSSDSDLVSSGNEGDTDGSTAHDIVARSRGSSEAITDDSSTASTSSLKECKVKRRSFNVDTIDIMTRRLLLAASRTSGGGDAYFVVRDLFGGEGVEVVPSTASSQGPYIGGNIMATIELTVRLASITIRCHSKFDVYPENVDSEPYIQLHTTTSETIELQEVRVNDDGLELEVAPNSHITDNSKPTKVMLKEKTTDKSGRRVLAIKPAKYEKVDNWHTPS